MYKHWRYRPMGATDYPFYSQESPAFEQIAARPDYAKLDRGALPGAEPGVKKRMSWKICAIARNGFAFVRWKFWCRFSRVGICAFSRGSWARSQRMCIGRDGQWR